MGFLKTISSRSELSAAFGKHGIDLYSRNAFISIERNNIEVEWEKCGGKMNWMK